MAKAKPEAPQEDVFTILIKTAKEFGIKIDEVAFNKIAKEKNNEVGAVNKFKDIIKNNLITTDPKNWQKTYEAFEEKYYKNMSDFLEKQISNAQAVLQKQQQRIEDIRKEELDVAENLKAMLSLGEAGPASNHYQDNKKELEHKEYRLSPVAEVKSPGAASPASSGISWASSVKEVRARSKSSGSASDGSGYPESLSDLISSPRSPESPGNSTPRSQGSSHVVPGEGEESSPQSLGRRSPGAHTPR